jgi:signal transduction histidine kinase
LLHEERASPNVLSMYNFLSNNHDELIARCQAKVALRPRHATSDERLASGVPLFLEQLIRTLRAEEQGEQGESLRISGSSGGDALAVSEMGVSAAAHGKVLLDLGFSVDQVVHAYGDLCQAITDLAVERDEPFSVDQFRTLNRCLDNAIAVAVAGFAEQRDAAISLQSSVDENQRLGFLVHELRNYLQTAMMAFGALESGKLAIGGSTAALVKRSLASLASLLTESVSGVRLSAAHLTNETFAVHALVADATITASLYARATGCTLTVSPVDPRLAVEGNRVRLVAALVNLLQNAFKFTRAHTEIVVAASGVDDRVLITVEDHCGGLPPGAAETLFRPFKQAGSDKSGLGLGLSIARRSVEQDGGSLGVTDLPGSGCVFTIDLPRRTLS